ncbi:hypothetical protein BU16DRAFT_217583 [Lophium mytilinum]|uniref:Uncharacterized protein n=1 Tax=Lophium mytilinum TaxID=390894 RepID=A0A6A6QAB1_9PEZI|nr:hypothetical protein BU16DRAFT_217583 [Lophium mytilinum]
MMRRRPRLSFLLHPYTAGFLPASTFLLHTLAFISLTQSLQIASTVTKDSTILLYTLVSIFHTQSLSIAPNSVHLYSRLSCGSGQHDRPAVHHQWDGIRRVP